MQITEAMARYQRQQQADARSPRTIASYGRSLRLLVAHLGDVEIETVTPDQLARFILSDAVQIGRAPVSLNHVKTALRSFFAYLVETGALDRSPAAALKIKNVGNPPTTVLGGAHLERLLATTAAYTDATSRRDHMLFALMSGTGLRVSSAVALDVTDVLLDQRRLLVTVKGGRRESTILSTRLRDLLAAFMEGRADGPLFLSNQRRRLSIRQVQTRLSHWLGVAGIDAAFTVHSLRHGFGTALYERTGDLHLVATVLHHRSVATTQRYARVADARIEAVMEAM